MILIVKDLAWKIPEKWVPNLFKITFSISPLIHRFLMIGNSNVFEVDSTSYALKIGDFNNVESKSIVGKSTVLTNGCIIGAGCKIVTEEIIPENCVIYGSKNDRRQQGDRPGPQTLQIEYLSKVLPNYHHLKKPTKK